MKHGVNGFVVLVAVIAGFGGFLFGYDSSVIADIKDQLMGQLHLSEWQWSEVVSVTLLGAVFGIPLSGLVADHLSRRTLLKLVATGFIAGTALCAQASGFAILLVGRALIGVCIGIASYVTPLFITEIAPPKKRGSLLLINGLAITFGQAVAYLIGYFLHDTSADSWRLVLWTGVIPALILFFGMFLVPHSPRWIMQRQGEEEALRVLKKIRSADADNLAEMREIAAIGKGLKLNPKLLLQRPVLYVLLVGVALGVFQQFSGIDAIMYYGPVIFQSAGFASVKSAILATFVIGLTNFIFTIVTCASVDRLGRRYLLLNGMLLATVALVWVAALFYFDSPNRQWGILLGLSFYVMGYCVSVGSLFWVVIAEIYPIAVRGLAMSVATVSMWVANFLVSLSFPGLYEAVGQAGTFALFGLVCLLAYIFIFYFVPETTGVSLEKIEENLVAGKRIRDIGQALDSSRTGLFTQEKIS